LSEEAEEVFVFKELIEVVELTDIDEGLVELVPANEDADDNEALDEDETLEEDPETATEEPDFVELAEEELLTAVLPVASAFILSNCNIFIRLDIALFCWMNGVKRLRVVNES
jgi:hypothetical protein